MAVFWMLVLVLLLLPLLLVLVLLVLVLGLLCMLGVVLLAVVLVLEDVAVPPSSAPLRVVRWPVVSSVLMSAVVGVRWLLFVVGDVVLLIANVVVARKPSSVPAVVVR